MRKQHCCSQALVALVLRQDDDAEVQELYSLLHENYVEDGDQMFRFDYSVSASAHASQKFACQLLGLGCGHVHQIGSEVRADDWSV